MLLMEIGIDETGVSAGRKIKAASLMWARMRLCCGVGENEDNKYFVTFVYCSYNESDLRFGGG